MNYTISINDRPFLAIRSKMKKIECRIPTSWDTTPYDRLKVNDTITFINRKTKASLLTLVLGVRHYPNMRSLVHREGSERTFSSEGRTEDRIRNFEKHPEYEENIFKFGVYAIEVDCF